MDSLVFYLVKLSLFNTILFFIITWICRLFRPYISKKQQYYLQLVPILGFVIPFYKAAEPFSQYLRSDKSYVILNTLPAYSDEPISGGQSYTGDGGPFLFYIWIAGAAIVTIYKLVQYSKYNKIISRNLTQVSDKQKQHIYAAVCKEMGLKKAPGLYECAFINTPILTHFGGCKVVLPECSFTDIQSMRLAFYHELVHFLRKDIWYKRLLSLVSTVHWFNPLLLYINRENSRCCELSCDEQVLKGLNHREKVEYGELILNTCKQNLEQQSQLWLFSSSKKLVKERLMLIAEGKSENMKLKKFMPKTVSFILLVVFSAMSLVSCGAASEEQKVVAKTTAAVVQKEETKNIRTVKGKDGKKHTEVVIPIKEMDNLDNVFSQPTLKGKEVKLLYVGTKKYSVIEGILDKVIQCPYIKLPTNSYTISSPSTIAKKEEIEDPGMVVLTLAQLVD